MPSARPLRLWLALRITLAATAPLALVAALILGVLLPHLRADIEGRYQTLARAIAGQIQAHLLGPNRELRAMAEYIGNRGYRPAPFWFDLLDAHAGTGDVFAAIYIVAADDSVYAVGLPQAQRGQRDNLLGLDLSQRSFLREARARNKEMWSDTFLSAVTGQLAVNLAIPTAEQVLVGEIPIDRLSKFLNRSPTETEMLTMILDQRGQIIAHSQAPQGGQQINLGHLSIVRDALEGRFATRDFELDGETFVGTSVNIPQLDWIVLVAQPRVKAFQTLLSTLWALATGALMALLLAILVAWALARGLARRIGRYAEQAHAIAEGDYDHPWPLVRIREFDNLAGDLERMSFAIRQRELDLATSKAYYRMLSDCNQALIRIADEIELLTTVCAIVVREGGYRMAWVGYAESDPSKTVQPMAHAGFEEGYLQGVNISWADDERGRGPIGIAVRTGRPCFIQNIASDPRLASRRAEAAKRGYAAVCALPLIDGDQVFGAMGIYSSTPDAFDTDEVAILSELASDLAFGITMLRARIEHERIEMALKESERKYRELVENANSIILRWNPQGEITFINEFGLKLFGYLREELIGQHVLGTIVPLDETTDRDLRPLMEDIRLYPERFEHNIHNIRRNGARLWIDWTNKAVLDERGQVIEIFSVGSDITDRKWAEEELERHREHLEELVAERTAELRQAMTQLIQTEKLAALGNLVAGVAHELNTPLGNARVVATALGEHLREFAVAVESGALRRSQVEGFLGRSREAVDLLERNTARAADLIGHFKQVAVDQASARRRRFDLRQTVEELLLTLQPQFKRTTHRVELDIPPAIELDSYPGPLEQIITNLITNSLTHGFTGIEAGTIRIHAAPLDPDRVQIDYDDDGVGIPEGTINRIFEPFFTTRLGSGGSGLGLYIVYNLVTGVLGGTIRSHSSVGQGAHFTLVVRAIAPFQDNKLI